MVGVSNDDDRRRVLPRMIADVYRLMLGRDSRPEEIEIERGADGADQPGAVARRLLASTDFRDRYFALVREPDPAAGAAHLEGLRAIAGDERFVDLAYEC